MSGSLLITYIAVCFFLASLIVLPQWDRAHGATAAKRGSAKTK